MLQVRAKDGPPLPLVSSARRLIAHATLALRRSAHRATSGSHLVLVCASPGSTTAWASPTTSSSSSSWPTRWCTACSSLPPCCSTSSNSGQWVLSGVSAWGGRRCWGCRLGCELKPSSASFGLVVHGAEISAVFTAPPRPWPPQTSLFPLPPPPPSISLTLGFCSLNSPPATGNITHVTPAFPKDLLSFTPFFFFNFLLLLSDIMHPILHLSTTVLFTLIPLPSSDWPSVLLILTCPPPIQALLSWCC